MNIKYKLFTITTGLLISLAMIIYITLTSLLPTYYHEYKIKTLENNLESVQQSASKYDTEHLIENMYYLCRTQNISVRIQDSSGKIIYGSNAFIISKYNQYISSHAINEEYRVTMKIQTNDTLYPYTAEIVMPLQPIDEASMVIKQIMPYILLIALVIGAIGAYIYSKTITKPLLEIIEKERELENNRRDFVATISHELKTPITIISGQLEGMIYNIGKYKDRDTYLMKSYESTQDLKNLVNEMINVSKSETAIMKLQITKTNLSELINQTLEKQNYFIEEKNIDVVLNIQKDVYVYCDEKRIEKAISNIVNNAIKYSPVNEKLIINLSKKSMRNSIIGPKYRVYMEVENTGVTIDNKYINEIFKPFYRIEKSRSRKTGGSGLGLYLTSQIFKSHGFYHNIRNKENSVVFILEIKQ